MIVHNFLKNFWRNSIIEKQACNSQKDKALTFVNWDYFSNFQFVWEDALRQWLISN